MTYLLRTSLAMAGAILVTLASVRGHAQAIPVLWSVEIVSNSVKQGQPFVAKVRAQIPYGWHLYSATQPPGGPIATTIVANNQAFTVRGKLAARSPDRAVEPLLGIDTETYADTVSFLLPMMALQAGRQTLELKINFQTCTDRLCAPEKTAIVKTAVITESASKGR